MAEWSDVQAELEGLLGSRNVYYQPPESIKMKYPAIKFSKTNYHKEFADNRGYRILPEYEVIVIDPMPDNPVIKKLLERLYCRFDRHYKADNLNHDVFRLY